MKRLSITFLFLLLFVARGNAATYYVDMDGGSDGYSCSQCQSPSTPKGTVQSVIDNCNLEGGDTVKIKGTAPDRFVLNSSGSLIHSLELVDNVNASIVDFSTTPSDVSTTTDYVILYNSRKGNSGAFKVTSVNGDQITVDTSRLPGRSFVHETFSDPGDLEAIIIRPINFEAWDDDNIPTFNPTSTYTGRVVWTNAQNYVRVYKIRTYWDFDTMGTNQYGSMFMIHGASYWIWDSVEVDGGRSAQFWEYGTEHSNTQRHMTQYCRFINMGCDGSDGCSGLSTEVVYNGNPQGPDMGDGYDHNHWMYNYFRMRNGLTDVHEANGIDNKVSCEYTTIWGNEFDNWVSHGAGGGIISNKGANAVIANNYFHDVAASTNSRLHVIVITGSNNLVFNNIIENASGRSATSGIRVDAWDGSIFNVGIFNNVIYNIDGPGSGYVAGIDLILNNSIRGEIKNNIFQDISNSGGNAYAVYANGSGKNPALSHNIAYNVATPWFGISCSDCSTSDPGLMDPPGGDFSIDPSSNARDAGTPVSTYFSVDNHDADSPSVFGAWPTLAVTMPIERDGAWDIGAYEYCEIFVTPTNIDYGEVIIGNKETEYAAIYNGGDSEIIIDDITLPDAPFDLPDRPNLPLTLGPGDRKSFEISFAPTSPGLFQDKVSVISNDFEEGSIDIDLEGTGLSAQTINTPNGPITVATAAGVVTNASFVDEATLPSKGKPDLTFPFGLISFTISGVTMGDVANIKITFPDNVTKKCRYWKYGATSSTPAGEWYKINVKDNDGDNTLVISIADGGLGDDDLLENTVIVDAGGPAIAAGAGGGGLIVGGSDRLGIKCTAPNAVNVRSKIVFEE